MHDVTMGLAAKKKKNTYRMITGHKCDHSTSKPESSPVCNSVPPLSPAL